MFSIAKPNVSCMVGILGSLEYHTYMWLIDHTWIHIGGTVDHGHESHACGYLSCQLQSSFIGLYSPYIVPSLVRKRLKDLNFEIHVSSRATSGSIGISYCFKWRPFFFCQEIIESCHSFNTFHFILCFSICNDLIILGLVVTCEVAKPFFFVVFCCFRPFLPLPGPVIYNMRKKK